jgi:GT2 family glycosyltransferase
METKIEKIGVGLITCDRPEFFKISYDSLCDATNNQNIEHVVVNDGETDVVVNQEKYIKTKGKTGVAKAKNLALKYLLQKGCTHIFLMEDDIQITNFGVFEAYIEASKTTGIKHFNYALHGNHNMDRFGNPTIRKTVKYPNTDISIDLYPNVLGAFSYYHIDVLKDVGLMDEDYYLSMEHVDHTYKASLKNYTSPWRYFADIHNSFEYLKDIVPDHQQSKIRNKSNFQEIFKNGLDLFIKKNGFSVVQGYGPLEEIVTMSDCITKLKEIYNNKDK